MWGDGEEAGGSSLSIVRGLALYLTHQSSNAFDTLDLPAFSEFTDGDCLRQET